MTGFSPWLAATAPHIQIWIGALCTIGLYSLLYRENKLYRLFEHIYLGLATGFLVANTWTDIIRPKWYQPMVDKGMWWYMFELMIGFYYYFIFSRRHNWMARLIIGFFLGVASGQAFQQFVNDNWPQIPATFKPLLPHAATATAKAVSGGDAVNNIIFVLMVVCVLSYFFFSFEHRNPAIKVSSKLGRWMMMFTFGAIFGSTVMARLALLIDRMYYLVFSWGGELGAETHLGANGKYLACGVIVVLVLLMLILSRRYPDDFGAPPVESGAGSGESS